MKQPFKVPQDAGIVRGDKGRFQSSNPQRQSAQDAPGRAGATDPGKTPPPEVPVDPGASQAGKSRPFKL